MFLTPLMIVVMLVGVLGMFGDAKAEVAYYLVPLYNSVQCMIGIFSFDFQPLNVAVCVIANLAYAGVGVLALQRMFDSAGKTSASVIFAPGSRKTALSGWRWVSRRAAPSFCCCSPPATW